MLNNGHQNINSKACNKKKKEKTLGEKFPKVLIIPCYINLVKMWIKKLIVLQVGFTSTLDKNRVDVYSCVLLLFLLQSDSIQVLIMKTRGLGGMAL